MSERVEQPPQDEPVRVPRQWLEAYHGDEDLARAAYLDSLATEKRVAAAQVDHPNELPRRQSRFARSNFDHPMR